MKWGSLFLLLVGCDAVLPRPPPDPPPVDMCTGLMPIRVTLAPAAVRVNGAASLAATGGTGRYRFRLGRNASGATVSGDRYLAGPTPGSDEVFAIDECQSSGRLDVAVTGAFDVQPSRAAVRPQMTFTIRTSGLKGQALFGLPSTPLDAPPMTRTLPSGGTITPQGVYRAGAMAATDLIVVRDSETSDQVLVQVQVSTTARLVARPPKLALPQGASVSLETLDGSNVVRWELKAGASASVGTLSGSRFRATGAGTTTIVGIDEFTQERCEVAVRVLTELSRAGERPQGRRTETQTFATGDFDGDGQQDLAVGVPESDLSRPQGGAVFVFRGTTTGLTLEPRWTLLGQSDTAQLGAVLAAGDLDGDGRDELVVAEPGADVTISDSGAVDVYSFSSDGARQVRAPLTGLGRGRFGASLAIGDVDGDGDQDLVVGSPAADLLGGAVTTRGVIDIFELQGGGAIPDLGSVRLSGVDLSPDGGTRATSGMAAGRGLLVGDVNGDGLADIATVTSVTVTLDAGVPVPRTQVAIQVHLGRPKTAPRRFEPVPDAFLLPSNPSDGVEGTFRLGFVRAGGSVPNLVVVAVDGADSPNLSAGDAGVVSGGNAGGVLLFDLRTLRPTNGAPAQIGREAAWARLFGDQPNMFAGRSFTSGDLDGDGSPELILGAPYGSTALPDGGTAVFSGRLLVFSLEGLRPGTVANRPTASRGSTGRGDTVGAAVTLVREGMRLSLATFAGRATTSLGDFTGRVDFLRGSGALATWATSSVEVPASVGGHSFGSTVDVARVGSQVRVMVGVPNISGPGADGLGNETTAGQSLMYSPMQPTQPVVLVEGAGAPYVRDGGIRAFGGRPVASDVTFTDFDGDGVSDAVVAMPSFTVPTRLVDGGVSVTGEYARVRAECLPTVALAMGGLAIFKGAADGTFSDVYRVWGTRQVEGCDAGGDAGACLRSAVGRTGLAGGFDFNGDGRDDVLALRTNGADVFLGQPSDGPGRTMSCEVGFAINLNQPTSAPAALGDMNADGCDEIGFRYADGARQGVLIAFGFDATGTACGARREASWVRVSGDAETGLLAMRLGVSTTRAGRVFGDMRDFLAITADLYPLDGDLQPAVLLVDVAQLVARRPARGEAVVGILGDGITPIPLTYRERAPGWGRMLWGNVDVTGDSVPDLVVSAPGANVNGDGTGAVVVLAGGSLRRGPNEPVLTVMADERERGSFGQDMALLPRSATSPPTLVIGAPISYRSGTANGSAFVLPLD